MGFRGLYLAFIAAVVAVASSGPAHAVGAASSAAAAGPSLNAGAKPIMGPVFHRQRVDSFYCYPRNYWWFYRPYTTALNDHARCMPYFHYLGPTGREKSKLK